MDRNYKTTDPDRYIETSFGFDFGPIRVERLISVQKGTTSHWVIEIRTSKSIIQICSTGTGKVVSCKHSRLRRLSNGSKQVRSGKK
jgi:hypothetical protein